MRRAAGSGSSGSGPWAKKVQRRLLDENIEHGAMWKAVIAGVAVFFVVLTVYWVTTSSNSDAYDINALPRDAAQYSQPQKQETASVPDIAMQVAAVPEVLPIKDDKEAMVAAAAGSHGELGDLPRLDAAGNLQAKRDSEQEMAALQAIVEEAPLVVISKTWCPFCTELKRVLKPFNQDGVFRSIEVDLRADQDLIMDAVQDLTGRRSVPKLFIAGEYVGGLDEAKKFIAEGKMVGLIVDAKERWAALNARKAKKAGQASQGAAVAAATTA